MALIIRMRQQGYTGRQHFRIVVADSRSPRDGIYIEKLGWLDPFQEKEKEFKLDIPRLRYWVDLGAQMSESVQALVKKSAPEVLQELSQKKEKKLAKKRAQRKSTAKKARPSAV